ncbi:MAG TPA: hypothetical protein PKK26_10040 [Candidatus Wallbacteria bacterium]|nr:hypothetical protein [Candidatus Wallbacteria bacterium]
MSVMDKVKRRYNDAAMKVEGLKTTDRLIIALASLLIAPFIFSYFIYPAQQASIKKMKTQLAAASARYETLKNEANGVDRNANELKNSEGELKKIDALILTSDAGVQFINTISNNVIKNGLDIKFIKKTAKYDGVYEKTSVTLDAGGKPDETTRFSYKMLPIEISFKSTAGDMMAFFNMVEGFKNVNFSTRKITADRTDDGSVDVTMVIEILIEIKFS